MEGIHGLRCIVLIDEKVRLDKNAELDVVDNSFSIIPIHATESLKFRFKDGTVTKLSKRRFQVVLNGIELLSPNSSIFEDIYQRRLFRAFKESSFSWDIFTLKLQAKNGRRITTKHMIIENVSCSARAAA